MILKKVIINGKEVFEPISFEDALKYNDHNNLIFTDEDEEEDFYDKLSELEELKEEIVDESLNEKVEQDEETQAEFKKGFGFNFENFGEMFGSFFQKSNKKSKSSNLIAALPFFK